MKNLIAYLTDHAPLLLIGCIILTFIGCIILPILQNFAAGGYHL